MGLTARFLGLFVLLTGTAVSHAQYSSSAEALNESARTGKPVLAVATSPTCPPCRALKNTLHTDVEVGRLLKNFVVLEMQASSADFTGFMERYAGEYFGVPMVHVLSGEGDVLYARSGGLSASQLQQLLSYAMAQAQPPQSRAIASNRVNAHQEALEAARVAALEGQLAPALEQVMPIATLDDDSREVTVARAYRDQLESAIGDWIDGLQQDIARRESPHSAAYRLAKLFTELPKESVARSKALHLMTSLETDDTTRIPMLQAKQLVRARLEEERKLCAEAIRSYQEVARLDASSPSGQYALNRIPELQERQELKLTSHP